MELSNIRVVTDSKTFVLLAIRKPPLYSPVFSLSTLADGDTFNLDKGIVCALARYVYGVPHPRLEEYTPRMYTVKPGQSFLTKHVNISWLSIFVMSFVILLARLSRHHRWWKVFSTIADKSLYTHKATVL